VKTSGETRDCTHQLGVVFSALPVHRPERSEREMLIQLQFDGPLKAVTDRIDLG
jgi:hypothetical protein